MTLTGTYSRALDEKQRLAVPKRLREQFGAEQIDSLYVAPGTDKSLSLYSPAAFEELARKLAQQSPNRAEVRNYLRLFYSQAESVPVDGQGRIRIPERLVAFAGLQKEIMLLGVQDHAEVWDREHWERFVAANEPGFDDMASRAFE
ncbi:MAG: division/cell wall cluster transcriptional repressor MraZ [Planctomycetales bacterium]